MNIAAAIPRSQVGTDRSLLIIDSDAAYARRLAQWMAERGFEPASIESVASVRSFTDIEVPAYAIIELRLRDGSGLEILEHLRSLNPKCKILILTSYGSLATAVAAIKLGAFDYLTKPVDIDVVHAVLSKGDDAKPPPLENLMTAQRVRWEHINQMLELFDNNISETARQLHMHRRTLQRILADREPS